MLSMQVPEEDFLVFKEVGFIRELLGFSHWHVVVGMGRYNNKKTGSKSIVRLHKVQVGWG